jgi:hypothetical protein
VSGPPEAWTDGELAGQLQDAANDPARHSGWDADRHFAGEWLAKLVVEARTRLGPQAAALGVTELCAQLRTRHVVPLLGR